MFELDGLLIFAVYSVWAVYSGYKMINGRYEWLERKETANKVCKAIAVLGAGYLIGGFYLIWWVIKVAFRVTDGFK